MAALAEKKAPETSGARTSVGRVVTASADKGVVYTFEDARLADKLLGLGLGFDEGGIDGGKAWLLRKGHDKSVAELRKGERLKAEAATKIALGVARDLDRCERAHVFLGPLTPDDVLVSKDGDGFLGARAYLAALFGGEQAKDERASGPSPKFTPPEQLDGAAWDGAANRYVLGLVYYRMLAGAPPETADGARAAFSARRAGVTPLPEDVAAELMPGVHAFLLRLLSADPAKRLRTSAEIVSELELARAPKIAIVRSGAKKSGSSSASLVAVKARASRRARAWPRALSLTISILALAIAATSVASLASKKEPDKARVALVATPLHDMRAEACASCHPREATEWKRSVMSHAATSPLFGALESAVEEQVGRTTDCPNGAGILRKRGADACFDRASGVTVTGSGGEHWCVNCHLPGENLKASMPAWNAFGSKGARAPVRDLASRESMEGISCVSCHTTVGPVHGGGYQGNPTWTSFKTGAVFAARPEDAAGQFGIGNSGYSLDEDSLVTKTLLTSGARVHKLPTASEKSYLRSSQFCGACHDVRLFGTDAIGVRDRGEHFKRLRNGYSEWRAWADDEGQKGRRAASCQDCHMTTFPGVCVQDATSRGGEGCPSGTRFSARAPGERGKTGLWSHDFTSVELPLADDGVRAPDDATLDGDGVPQGLSYRQSMLVARALSFKLGGSERRGDTVRVPVEIVNVGAGHRVPAGFSQEREIWVELSVRDADGRLVYDVGRVGRADEDLADKRFLRVRTDDEVTDGKGRPLGVFGADVTDGPDVPQWKKISPNEFVGKGLVNLQNGFQRCVRCIGFIDGDGKCQAGPDQGRTRADRFDDGDYDLDTGECRSNLSGDNAFFETYFPIGSLDADRGLTKAPDAIIDTRSAAPGVRQRYNYELDTRGHKFPLTVSAKLRFRAFPPYLLRAFADYEARKASRGERPSGAQVTSAQLARLRILDLHEAEAVIE